METARFINALERDLAAVAAVGDEETAAAAERLIQALRGSAGLRAFETMGGAALDVGGEPAETPALGAEDGLTARITLRLPEGLKRELEAAAAREGVSLNTWLIRALARSTAPPVRRSGNRLTGYGRS